MERPSVPRVFIGKAPIDAVSCHTAAAWLLEELKCKKIGLSQATPLQVMGPNAFLVTLAARNKAFAAALRHANLCPPDGMSVVWGARLLGALAPERVPGGEFMERMCALFAEHGLSVYLLGGLPGAAEGAAKVLCAKYPGLHIAGTDCPPFGFEQDDAANEAVRERIIAARPDLLCVALGAPKQEVWMLDECDTLPIGAALSVGAAFDTLSGLRRRAPAWTHNIGAEWLYRLAKEPRRLWRRYLIGNVRFAAILTRTWLKRRKGRAVDELLHDELAAGVWRHSHAPLSKEEMALLHPEALHDSEPSLSAQTTQAKDSRSMN